MAHVNKSEYMINVRFLSISEREVTLFFLVRDVDITIADGKINPRACVKKATINPLRPISFP